jgi:hypothetical protein
MPPGTVPGALARPGGAVAAGRAGAVGGAVAAGRRPGAAWGLTGWELAGWELAGWLAAGWLAAGAVGGGVVPAGVWPRAGAVPWPAAGAVLDGAVLAEAGGVAPGTASTVPALMRLGSGPMTALLAL